MPELGTHMTDPVRQYPNAAAKQEKQGTQRRAVVEGSGDVTEKLSLKDKLALLVLL